MNHNRPCRLFIQLLTAMLFILSWAQCAKEVAPDGGPRDNDPPELVDAEPPNQTIHFSSDRIRLFFNEFINLKNPLQKVLVSPPMNPPPDINYRKKMIKVDFLDTLRPNTTYNVYFDEAIADITEDNTIPALRYVFSTGAYLDSLEIEGVVYRVPEDQPAENVFVMLYRRHEDSVVYKKKPIYFTKTDKDGKFTLPFLRRGIYKLFALDDINNNLLFDLPNEAIAFSDTLINVHDTVLFYQMQMFEEDKMPLQVVKSSYKTRGKVDFVFNRTLPEDAIFENMYPERYAKRSTARWEYVPTRDTFTYWTTNVFTDSLVFRWETKEDADTVTLFAPRDTSRRIKTLKLKSPHSTRGGTRVLRLDKPVVLTASAPLRGEALNPVILAVDSPALRDTLQPVFDDYLRKVRFTYDWKEETEYKLFVPPGTFENMFGHQNDTLQLTFRTKSKEDYGVLELILKQLPEDTAQYIVEVRSGNSIAARAILRDTQTVRLSYLKPATYTLLVIHDRNRNGKWDTGDYLKKKQPEHTTEYKEKIELRANWSIEVNMNEHLYKSVQKGKGEISDEHDGDEEESQEPRR